MDSSGSFYKYHDDLRDSGPVLNAESSFQETSFGPVEELASSSVSGALHSSPAVIYSAEGRQYQANRDFQKPNPAVICPGQDPHFQAKKNAHLGNPTSSQYTSFGALLDGHGQLSMSDSSHESLAHQESSHTSWNNHAASQKQRSMQELYQQSNVDMSLPEHSEPGYIGLLGIEDFPHPALPLANLPMQMKPDRGPYHLHPVHHGLSESPPFSSYLLTPSPSNLGHRNSFSGYPGMQDKPFTPRRTQSECMRSPDISAQLNPVLERSQTGRKRPSESSKTSLQVPPQMHSQGVTCESPDSSMEFFDDSPDRPNKKKRARTLTSKGRVEAAEVRRVGACGLCRERKVKCNPAHKGIIQTDEVPTLEDSYNVLFPMVSRLQDEPHRTLSSFALEIPASVSRYPSSERSPTENEQGVLPKVKQGRPFHAALSDRVSMNTATGAQFLPYANPDGFPETLSPEDFYGLPSPSLGI